MEVKTADAKQALTIFEQDYLRSTGLSREDLSTAEVILDEAGAPAICPACGTSFIPDENATCPECELSFG